MSNPPQINPLSDAHCHACDLAIQTAAQVRDLIKRCKELGHDCSEYEAALAQAEAYAHGVKRQFFPDRP